MIYKRNSLILYWHMVFGSFFDNFKNLEGSVAQERIMCK